MKNGIAAALEADLARAAFHLIAADNFLCQPLLFALHLGYAHARNRTANHGGDVWVLLFARMRGVVFPARIWACAFAFASCNQKLVAMHRKCRGVPLGGNEIGSTIVVWCSGTEHSDRIRRSICDIQP